MKKKRSITKSFGEYVSVGTNPTDKYGFAKPNWSAIGPQSIHKTEVFIKNLQRAIDFCKKLKNK